MDWRFLLISGPRLRLPGIGYGAVTLTVEQKSLNVKYKCIANKLLRTLFCHIVRKKIHCNFFLSATMMLFLKKMSWRIIPWFVQITNYLQYTLNLYLSTFDKTSFDVISVIVLVVIGFNRRLKWQIESWVFRHYWMHLTWWLLESLTNSVWWLMCHSITITSTTNQYVSLLRSLLHTYRYSQTQWLKDVHDCASPCSSLSVPHLHTP
jgi:hypothetical protein